MCEDVSEMLQIVHALVFVRRGHSSRCSHECAESAQMLHPLMEQTGQKQTFLRGLVTLHMNFGIPGVAR